MDRAEVTKVLSQVIENYQRCGLRRMGRSTPSAELLAAVQEAGAENGVETISEQKVVQNPAAAAVVSPPDSRAELRQPAGTGQSPSTAPGVGAQDWTLPVLDDRERSTHFAELETQVQQCRACKDIVDFRHQTVFGTGPLRPKICFMGEAPGADEDRLGEPFVGKAGQLLTRIIKAMKLEREEVYILNALKCRPPQNRTPVPEEISNCRGYVESQLEVLRPEYLVCLGAVAVQSLLQTKQPVGRLRGKFHSYKGARVVVTYHPSYLLRNADAKKFVWDDMKMLMRDMGVEL